MRLRITDLTAILVDADVVSVRAEDVSGGFGILPGHADFLTTLAISVVAWRTSSGDAGFCAVRHGLLSVSDGQTVAVATREGQVGGDLETLEREVLARYRADDERDRTDRTAAAKLRMQAIRHMVAALQDGPRELGL